MKYIILVSLFIVGCGDKPKTNFRDIYYSGEFKCKRLRSFTAGISLFDCFDNKGIFYEEIINPINVIRKREEIK